MSQLQRLLFVDNDERILDLCSWYFRERGFAVQTAPSFARAREILAESAPDLLLSDIDLGVENAREELPRLAREGILPPTLVVSGYLDAQSVNELGVLDEVVGSVAKPFDFPTLEARVRSVLAERVVTLTPQAPPASTPETNYEEDEEGWIEIKPAHQEPLPREEAH